MLDAAPVEHCISNAGSNMPDDLTTNPQMQLALCAQSRVGDLQTVNAGPGRPCAISNDYGRHVWKAPCI